MAKTKVKRDRLEVTGIIREAFRGGLFEVSLTGVDTKVLASVCGKMRKAFIRIIPGDSVVVELSEYDTSRGRIVRRLK